MKIRKPESEPTVVRRSLEVRFALTESDAWAGARYEALIQPFRERLVGFYRFTLAGFGLAGLGLFLCQRFLLHESLKTTLQFALIVVLFCVAMQVVVSIIYWTMFVTLRRA